MNTTTMKFHTFLASQIWATIKAKIATRAMIKPVLPVNGTWRNVYVTKNCTMAMFVRDDHIVERYMQLKGNAAVTLRTRQHRLPDMKAGGVVTLEVITWHALDCAKAVLAGMPMPDLPAPEIVQPVYRQHERRATAINIPPTLDQVPPAESTVPTEPAPPAYLDDVPPPVYDMPPIDEDDYRATGDLIPVNKPFVMIGKLVGSGMAKYDRQDSGERSSDCFYIDLETKRGTRRVWGIDLKKKTAFFKTGTLVQVEKTGKLPVVVKVRTTNDQTKEKCTHRNMFVVTQLKGK